MKKILFAASAIAIAMGMASCSDYFLDLNPTDQQTEANFYKTPEEFEAAANSTYSFYGFGDVSETVNGTKYTSSYYDIDYQTIGIKAFNDLVACDPRVEKVILPLRDGLTIIRKK